MLYLYNNENKICNNINRKGNQNNYMYINEPVLKSNKKKPKTLAKSINEYQFSTPEQNKKKQTPYQNSNDGNKKKGILKVRKSRLSSAINAEKSNFSDPDSHSQTAQTEKQKQFERNLQDEIEQLIKKWENSLKIIESDLSPFSSTKQSQSQKKAFEHCKNLLESQFNQAEDLQEKQQKLIDKKKLQIDDYKLRIQKQIQELSEQNKVLNEQRAKFNEQQRERQKKINQRMQAMDKAQMQKQKVEKLRQSLLQCKQKSYEQKNQFVELQSQQFRLENEIRQLEQQDVKYEESLIRKQKYDQLLKIKQKVINSHSSIEEQIRPHLERKIQKMAKLRTSIKSLQQALEICFSKIQDQNIIIEALKQKSYHEEVYQKKGTGNDPYEMYYRRYSEIYFGQKKQDDWKDYSLYLKHLVNKNNNLNSRLYTQIPHSNNGTPTNQNYDVLDLRNNFNKRQTHDKFYGNSTKISTNPERYKTQQIPQKQYNGTKLPRIVKLEGKANQEPSIKKKVKQGILKHNNKQEDFDLESIKSGQSKVSGDIIEVEFHKK